MDEDETFPGQLPIGSVAFAVLYDEDRPVVKNPIGFFAPSNLPSLDGVAKAGKPSRRAKSPSPRRPKRV